MSMSMSGLKKDFWYNNKYPLPSSRFINHSPYQKNSKKCYWVTSNPLYWKTWKIPQKVTKSFSNFTKKSFKSCL